MRNDDDFCFDDNGYNSSGFDKNGRNVYGKRLEDFDENGLDVLDRRLVGNLARFRRFELAAAINRLRTLEVSTE